MLEQGSNASDMATRAEIYKRVLAETGNEAEAVFQASEVMNFSRRGNFPVMQVLTAIVPFMNARIQGLDVLYRSGFGQGANANTEKMQKAFIVRSMAILGMTAAYWFMVHDDDEYKKLTKEERDGYWIVPGLKFNDKPFRFPIPFEIGVVFKVFPERIAEYIWGGDTEKISQNPSPATSLIRSSSTQSRKQLCLGSRTSLIIPSLLERRLLVAGLRMLQNRSNTPHPLPSLLGQWATSLVCLQSN